MRYPIIALVLALAGFAGSLGCFVPPGTRKPRPASPPPSAGPHLERGGQRMRAAPPADPAAAARAALTARGWTVVASRRDDEVLGVIHDNTAVLRWSADGWWARVDQRSDVATREQLPHWDHPWEALRLLHLVAPDAGPAVGWKPFAGLAEQWQGERAEAAYRAPGDASASGPGEVAEDHLLAYVSTRPADPGLVRDRLRAALRAAPPVPAPPPAVQLVVAPHAGEHAMARRGVYREPSRVLSILERGRERVLVTAVAERRDPWTALPAQVVFDLPADTRRAAQPLPIAVGHMRSDRLVRILVESWRQRDRSPRWWDLDLAMLAGLQPPGSDLLPVSGKADAGSRDGIERWWTEHGLAWLDALAAEPAP